MDIPFWIQVAAQIGFPMVFALLLFFRGDATLRALGKAIHRLAVEEQKEREEQALFRATLKESFSEAMKESRWELMHEMDTRYSIKPYAKPQP